MLEIFYSRSTVNNERTKEKFPYVQLVISLLGVGSSFWTYLLHIQLKAQAGNPLICDVNETINCSKIIGSSQGEVFGVPLGIWGMVYWLMALGLISLPYVTKVSHRYAAFWRLFVASIGAISALALVYISYFVLKGICEFCTVVQISCLAYFVAALLSFRKIKSQEHLATPKDFSTFTILMVVALLLPLSFFIATKNLFFTHYKKMAPLTQANEDYQIMAPYLPVLDAPGEDYYKGNINAPIELVEFTDFECPYCQLLHERLEELQDLIDQGKIKIYFRNWPLSYHKYATRLAIAARCAGQQGHFWDFADWAFRTAKQYAREPEKKEKLLSDNGINTKAQKLELELELFQKCISDPAIIKKIKKDGQDAQYLGGEGTPFLLLNKSAYQGNWLAPGNLRRDILKLIKK